MKKSGKKLLSLAISAGMLLSGLQMAHADDLKGHWAEESIREMQAKGNINGYGNGSFKPFEAMSRAEYIAVLNRSLGFKDGVEISFTDVKSEDWFAKDLSIAVAKGYVKGFPDGSFRPHDKLSRAQSSVMMARALGLEEDAESTEQFKDVEMIPTWARGSVGALLKSGLIKGYPDGSFGSDKLILRGEAAHTIHKASSSKDVTESEKSEIEKEDQKKEAPSPGASAGSGGSSSGGSGSSSGGSSSGSGSGSGGSGSNSGGSGSGSESTEIPEDRKVKSIRLIGSGDISQDDGTIEIGVEYEPQDALDQGVEWSVVEGENRVEILKSDDNSVTLKALNNGLFAIRATLKSDRFVSKKLPGSVSGQMVGLEQGSKGIAGFSQIINLEQGKSYVLKSGNKYRAIDSFGNLILEFDSVEEAKLFSFPVKKGTRIDRLDNAKEYSLIEVEAELNQKIAAYINKFQSEVGKSSINLMNHKDVRALTRQINDAAVGENQSLIELSNEVAVILNREEEKFNSIIQSISENCLLIHGKLTFAAAEEILEKIHLAKEKISNEDWNNISGIQKVEKLKDDLKRHRELDGLQIRFSEEGTVNLKVNSEFKWNLFKNGTTKVYEEDGYLDAAIPSQLSKMTEQGAGKYKIGLIQSFDFLEERVFFTNELIK